MTEPLHTPPLAISSGGEEVALAVAEAGGPPTTPANWTCEQVGSWLVECGFGQYRDAFVLNDVSGSILVAMDRASLAELVPSLGHRLQLLDQIERLTGPKPPRHVGEGVVGGVTGLASKCLHGLSHLVNDPLEGVTREGVSGLVKGLGTGLSGAIQYPVEGMALFSRQLGDGFRHTPDTIFGATPAAPPSSTLGSWVGTTSAGGYGPIAVGKIESAKPAFLQPEGKGDSWPKPAHVGEGVMMGFRRLGSGIYDGLTGIVVPTHFQHFQ